MPNLQKSTNGSQKTVMGTRSQSWGWRLGLAIFLTIGELLAGVGDSLGDSFASRTLAQIIPDTTLGAENSVVTPNVNIRGLPADRIDGGATRGANIFHSFSDFNVKEGLRVYFASPAGIENILTRVTGNNLSNILGTLGVDGGANLFLLNPNGIIFGLNARLDIAGSFVASTANSVVFENGFAFSASNPQAPPLLSIKVPLGLQYGSNHPGATITNSGNLAVGKNLGLAADNLNLEGQLLSGGNLALFASNTIQVRDRTDKPFIASAGGQMVVQGNQQVDIFALNHPESGFFSGGDMVLRSHDSVLGDARYSTGGNFQIEGLDGNPGELSSRNDPIIRSRGDVRFNNYIGTSLHILAGGSVTIPGIVVITAPETGTVGVDYLAENITLSDATVVPINGRAQPTLDVRAGVDQAQIGSPLGLTGDDLFVDLFNFSLFGQPTVTNTATSADIKIGGIAMLGMNAANGQVFLTNQYKPNGSLPGGNIEIGAIVTTDNVSQFVNQLPTGLRNFLGRFGLLDGFSGNGGSVIIDSRNKITMDGSSLANYGINVGLINTSSATGNAGDITLLAKDTVSLANSFLLSDTSGTGKGGDITIKVRSVSLTNNSLLSASTFGTGQGGNVTVVAPESVELVGSYIFAATDGEGNAGNLTISTGTLRARSGAEVSTSTFNRGRGGNLTVNATQRVELIGISEDAQFPSGLFSSTGGSGNGGDIKITTPQLFIQEGAAVSTGSGRASDLLAGRVSDNTGNGGNLTVTADLIELSGTSANPILRSAFQAGTAGFGNAGDMRIDTKKLIVRDGAVILAATLRAGNSGSITVKADSVEVVGTAPDNLPSGLSTGTAGTGVGKDLTINTRTLSVRDGALISAATFGQGAGGNLIVNASELIELVGTGKDGRPSGLSAGSGIEGVSSIPLLRRFGVDPSKATGDSGQLNITTGRLVVRDKAEVSTATIGPGIGGNIQLTANSVDLSNGAQLSAATSGSGRAGNILVQGADSINLASNSSISTSVKAGAVVNDTTGGGGNINLQARQLSLTNGSEVAASTSGRGNAGSISVRDADSVSLTNSAISTAVNAGAVGQGGKIDIQTRSLSLDNGAQVSAATSGQGNAGSIAVRNADSITLSNSSISSAVNAGAVADNTLGDRAGNINLQTRQLSLTNGAQVSAATSGQGNAGSIAVRNAQEVSLTNSAISTAVNAGAVGQGGKIDIQTRSLSLDNGAQVSAATSGQGNAGSIAVRDAESITLNNSSISSAVNAGAVADNTLGDRAGNINLQTRQLSLTNGAQISAATSGQGNAGSIAVRDADSVSLTNSAISTAVNAGAVGQGGKIDIQTRSLSLNNGAQVSAATSGTGKAGNISVREASSVALNNSSISTAVNAGAVGDGGDIDIQTRSLSVSDYARISASTSGQGNAGSITVTANTLEATNGGQFLTSTASSENAGNITLAVSDGVKLVGEGSGVFANTAPDSTGNGGSIFLNPRTLLVQNGAGIAVGSQGTGKGGDIQIQSDSITLDNRAFISAKTASNTGGNISLGVQDILLMRRGSEISTTAGTAQAGGDGGNITIKAGFILGIPRENSDITANAFTGRGGNINITTQGIFGLQFRPRLTPLSDITASSEFGLNGTVQIITPGIDPNRGLAELPTDLVDATGLIDRRCTPGEGTTQNSSFTVTGRGGLPPNPNETLGEESLLEDLGSPVGVIDGRSGRKQASATSSIPPKQLVEAQGWIIAPDGTVILTAQAPTATLQHPWQTPASCQTLSNSIKTVTSEQ